MILISVYFQVARLSTSGFKNARFHDNADSALDGVNDGAKLLVGGFGLCGIPENLIQGLLRRGTKNLTVVSNNAG